MYAIVQFGDKEEKICNLNCKCLHLLHCFRDNGHVTEDVELDLADDRGNVKLLHQNLDCYAHEFLQERERLVLIRVDRNDISDYMYTPLLNNESIVNPAYLAQLESRTSASRLLRSTRLRAPLPMTTTGSASNGRRSAARSTSLQSPVDQSPVRSPKTPGAAGPRLSTSGQPGRQKAKPKNS